MIPVIGLFLGCALFVSAWFWYETRNDVPVVAQPVPPNEGDPGDENDCAAEGYNRLMRSGRPFVIRQTPSRIRNFDDRLAKHPVDVLIISATLRQDA